MQEFWLIVLAEEVSRQPGIDWDMWVLVITLMQIKIAKKSNQDKKSKYKVYSLRRKKRTGKCLMLEPCPMLKR